MEKILYKLPVFEGPLDLLLFLISKNKLNIYDIQISELLEQYMEHIRIMQEQDLDVASEFLEMAARLVHIKSSMLLPKHEEEAEGLKRDLSGQLIEYQECKRAAARLAGLISFDSFVRAPSEVEFDLSYHRKHEAEELFQAYLAAAGKGRKKLPPPPEAFNGIVTRKIVSVASRIVYVMRSLRRKKEMRYNVLFEQSESRSELVAIFLAVLELVKGKRVLVEGGGERQTVKLLSKGEQKWKSESFNHQ